jgi:tripartite-type tricarboxylate transporter receptor subunit TctC
MAPAKTPPAIIKRLNAEIANALRDPEIRSRLAQENAEPLGSTPEEYAAYLKGELERWTKVIKNAGIKLE